MLLDIASCMTDANGPSPTPAISARNVPAYPGIALLRIRYPSIRLSEGQHLLSRRLVIGISATTRVSMVGSPPMLVRIPLRLAIVASRTFLVLSSLLWAPLVLPISGSVTCHNTWAARRGCHLGTRLVCRRRQWTVRWSFAFSNSVELAPPLMVDLLFVSHLLHIEFFQFPVEISTKRIFLRQFFSRVGQATKHLQQLYL